MICCARLTAAACGQLESVTLLHQGWSNGQVTWRVTRTSNIHLTSNGRWSGAGPCWQLRHYDGHRGAGLYFTHFCSIGCCHYSLMKHQPFTSFTFSNPSHKVTTFDSLVILNRLNTTKVQKVCVAGSWIFLSVDCFIFFTWNLCRLGILMLLLRSSPWRGLSDPLSCTGSERSTARRARGLARRWHLRRLGRCAWRQQSCEQEQWWKRTCCKSPGRDMNMKN